MGALLRYHGMTMLRLKSFGPAAKLLRASLDYPHGNKDLAEARYHLAYAHDRLVKNERLAGSTSASPKDTKSITLPSEPSAVLRHSRRNRKTAAYRRELKAPQSWANRAKIRGRPEFSLTACRPGSEMREVPLP